MGVDAQLGRTAAAIVRGLKEIFKPVVFLATSFRVSSFCVQSAVQGDRGRSHSGPVLLDAWRLVLGGEKSSTRTQYLGGLRRTVSSVLTASSSWHRNQRAQTTTLTFKAFPTQQRANPRDGVYTNADDIAARRPDHVRIIMALESACPDDYMDMDTTGAPRPPRPNSVSTQDEETGGTTDVREGTAAPVQEVPRDGTSASTIRSLNDDGPPIPLLHVVNPEKETEGPQLHDGPPGPPCFPSEFDDSLAKTVENELERNRSDHVCDNASTVHSNTSAVVPSMVEGVEEEEGSISSPGTAPSMSSHRGAGGATTTARLNPPSGGRSTLIVEAYRVEEAEEEPGEGTVYEAEIAGPNVILRFYQRKSFVSVVIAVIFLAVVITVVAVVLFLKNSYKDTGKTLSAASDPRTPVPTTSAPTSNPTRDATLLSTSNPINNPTDLPTSSPTKSPTNLPTKNPVLTLNSSLKLLAPDGAAYDRFGGSVAIYGDTIVVGAPGRGSAHVFVQSGEEWMRRAKLLTPDGASYDNFGQS
ncbi:hypothetical protein THAOC_08631, partial [Thalassiosira oceanica]